MADRYGKLINLAKRLGFDDDVAHWEIEQARELEQAEEAGQ